ncbi:MAG TPA: 2-ketoglutarate oxidoreductase subunit delta [Desulfobulbus sp.]|nr:2-ketoglutarate oxidoreductase subunit delta [Desulfobulbus sp.]
MAEKSAAKKQSCAQKSRRAATKKKKQYDVSFYHDWCKACGICMAFCPQKIIQADKNGKPFISEMDKCVGCRFCEIHCPDFAITVSDRKRNRRQNDV